MRIRGVGGAVLQTFGFLDHDNGVGAIGQRRASGDVGYGAPFDAEVCERAGADLADERVVTGAVGGDDGVAVLGGGGEGWEGFAGGDVGGEDGAPHF